MTRDELYEALKYDNVYARKYFFPSGQDYDCYKDMEFAVKADVPAARTVSSRILCLPIYNSLGENDVHKICDLLSAISRNSRQIKKKLKGAA
jgi:dTDP-4-amino-4,6-dideoxygalactose transaminase